MFFYVSKILMFLIQPLNWIIIILILAIFHKNKKRASRLYLLAFLLLITFSNPFLINQLYNNWEPAPKSYTELGYYDLVIVLGGFSNASRPPRDRVHFVKGADRLIHAMEIYKIGKTQGLLLSGGSSRIVGEKISEAKSVMPFLLNMGIPRDSILLEANSRNTHENAKASKELIDSKYKGGKFLLITSAFHMRRAKACFEKEGIQVTAFPTDYYGNEINWSPVQTFIPKSDAFHLWNLLIKEWLGIIAYKIAGYI